MTVLLTIFVTIGAVVALLGADRLVLSRAEQRIAEEVATQVGVPVRVQIGGTLPGLSVLAGRIDRLSLAAESVPAGDVVLDRLDVEVLDLRLEGDLPVAGTGTFVASLGQARVRQAAPPLLRDLVTLEPGRAVVGTGLLTVPLVLTVAGDVLTVAPDIDPGVAQLLSGVLPELVEGLEVPLDVPAGVVVTRAAVVDATLQLSGTLDPVVVAGS